MRAHIRFFQPVFNLLLGLDGSSLALTTLGGGGPDGSGTPPPGASGDPEGGGGGGGGPEGYLGGNHPGTWPHTTMPLTQTTCTQLSKCFKRGNMCFISSFCLPKQKVRRSMT